MSNLYNMPAGPIDHAAETGHGPWTIKNYRRELRKFGYDAKRGRSGSTYSTGDNIDRWYLFHYPDKRRNAIHPSDDEIGYHGRGFATLRAAFEFIKHWP